MGDCVNIYILYIQTILSKPAKRVLEVGVWCILYSSRPGVASQEDERHLNRSCFPFRHLLKRLLVEKLSQDYAMLPPRDVEAANELAALRTLDRSVQ